MYGFNKNNSLKKDKGKQIYLCNFAHALAPALPSMEHMSGRWESSYFRWLSGSL